MKKVALFFFPWLLLAAPVGNPSGFKMLDYSLFSGQQKPLQISSGYAGNFIFDRRLQQVGCKDCRIDRSEIYVHSGGVQLELYNSVCFFANLGSGKMESDFRLEVEGISKRAVTKTQEEFYWAFGGNVVLLDSELFTLGTGFSYNTYSPLLRLFLLDGVPYTTQNKRFDYQEWQANLGISHRIDFLIPYVGVKYSHTKSRMSLPNISTSLSELMFENRQNIGLYLGCSVKKRGFFVLTIEARLLDEEAVSVSARVLL